MMYLYMTCYAIWIPEISLSSLIVKNMLILLWFVGTVVYSVHWNVYYPDQQIQPAV